MKTRYTTSSDQDGIYVKDLLAPEGAHDTYGPYNSITAADRDVALKTKEWLEDLQLCKDELQKAGAIIASEDHSIQTRLDRAKNEPWSTHKRSWGHDRRKS